MAIIKSGLSPYPVWAIDAGANAGRTSLYYSVGEEILKRPVGSYLIPIPSGRLTAVLAIGSAIWSLRNGTTRRIRIKRIVALCSFDGVAAASTSGYQLWRYSVATPSGGTVLTPVRKSTTDDPVSTIADARFDYTAPLTIPGTLVWEHPFAEWGCQRQVNANNQIVLSSDISNKSMVIELAPGEGIAIRLRVASVVGDGLGGFVEWEEF